VIQIAQPQRVREQLARGAALRVVIPLLLLPVLGAAIVGVVRSGLLPLQRIAIEVQRRGLRARMSGPAALRSQTGPSVRRANEL
jgi:hypothetical protein